MELVKHGYVKSSFWRKQNNNIQLMIEDPILITICVQDGHPTDQRPFHDLQRLWGRKYEQAGIRLLLEWMDKEGFSHPNSHHCRTSVVVWWEDHVIGYW